MSVTHSIEAERRKVSHHLLNRIQGITPTNIFRIAISRAKLDAQQALEKLDFSAIDRLLLAIRDLGMPEITLTCYRQFQLSDFGLLGYAVANSRYLGEAIDHSIRFHQLTGNRFSILRRKEVDQIVLSPQVNLAYQHQAQDICEEFIAGYWRTLELLLGDTLEPGKITLTLNYPKPDYWPKADQRFPCKVIFNSASCQVSFPESWLAKPLETAAEDVADLCAQQCLEILDNDSNESVTAQVRMAILYAGSAKTGLNDIAIQLHRPPRTLRDQLYREGTSFRAISLDLRMTLAQRYLKATLLSIKEIAYLLGYSQPSAFQIAFKGYCKMAPGQYRNQEAATIPGEN
ncbi:MAG: AraC family transcriptional regulator ligand-binding domain-containing protein [Halopseudomonas sp.]